MGQHLSEFVARPFGDPRRPLVICDIDEVVLEFVTPFTAFLAEGGYSLSGESFRLHGNVRRIGTDEVAAHDVVSGLLEGFFAAQEAWQLPVAGAAEALARVAGLADVAFLSAMPPRHAAMRRRLLDRHGLARFPLVASEEPKGSILRDLRGRSDRPAVFIDDLPHNHHAVLRDAPGAHCIHLMANAQFRAILPPLPEAVAVARDWPHAVELIESLLTAR